MQLIRRTVTRADGPTLKHARGPFLTGCVYEDPKPKPLVVTLYETYLTVRQLGRRRGMDVSYERLYLLAAKIEQEQEQKRRAAAEPPGKRRRRRDAVSRGKLR